MWTHLSVNSFQSKIHILWTWNCTNFLSEICISLLFLVSFLKFKTESLFWNWKALYDFVLISQWVGDGRNQQFSVIKRYVGRIIENFSATDKNKHKIVNKNKSEKKKTEIEFKFQDRSRHSVQDAIAKIWSGQREKYDQFHEK